MIRTQIQLTDQMAAKVRQAAEQQKMPVAALIRQAVSFFFAASSQGDADERHARAASAAGAFSSGRSDLSAHHDEHFAEASRK